MSGESPLAGKIVLKKTRVRLLVIFRLGRKLEMIGLWQSFCMSAKALQSQSTFVPHFSPWIPQSGMTRSPHPAAIVIDNSQPWPAEGAREQMLSCTSSNKSQKYTLWSPDSTHHHLGTPNERI